MLLIFKLAWRSMRRHRRRSIITGAAAALSLAMVLLFVGVGNDSHARMAETGIRMGAGHVLIQGKGYQASQTLEHLLADPAAILARVRGMPEVVEAAPRLRANGLLSAGESSAPVLVSGVDPAREARASDLPAARRRVAGGYLRSRAALPFKNQPADIYLGAELARTLGLQVGDRTVLSLSPPGASRPSAAAYLVRGIFRTGVDELDRAWAEVPLEEAQAQLGIGERVTGVAVLLGRLEDTAAVTARLRRELDGSRIEVLPWQEALRELHEAIVLDDGGLYLMMGVIFVIMAIGILNTVLMSVVERTREFGVMMALGTGGTQICGVVLLESLLLGLFAGATGLGLGLGLHLLVARVGFDIGALAGDYEMAGIILEGRIFSRLEPGPVAIWTAIVVGLTLISAVYPALRAAHLKPVEAIRHV